MTNTAKIESKLAFDKIRESIAARCSTGYGRDRAEGEQVSDVPYEIERRLGLTDEMRPDRRDARHPDVRGFLPYLRIPRLHPFPGAAPQPFLPY